MEMSSSLMTATGLGFYIYLRDQFTRTAQSIGSSASLLSKNMAGAAASINSSVALMGGGAALIGAGVVGLKIGGALARGFDSGIGQYQRELLVKGIGEPMVDEMSRLALSLGSNVGIGATQSMKVLIGAVETGVNKIEDLRSTLPGVFEYMVGTGAGDEAATNLMRVRKELGYALGDMRSLSGKIQIAEDLMQLKPGALSPIIPRVIGQVEAWGGTIDKFLLHTTALVKGGMDPGEAFSKLGMAYKTLDMPGRDARAVLGSIADGALLASINTGRYAEAFEILADKTSRMSKVERNAFMSNLGATKPMVRETLSLLMKYSGEFNTWQEELGRGLERHKRSFGVQFNSYGWQIQALRENWRGLWQELGEGTAMQESPVLKGLNSVVASGRAFLRDHPRLQKALGSIVLPASRIAITAGIAAFGLGALKYGLSKTSFAAAEGAGYLRTFGTGLSFLATKLGPVALVLGAIATAFAGIRWAYNSNYLGFKDWAYKIKRDVGLVSEAVIASFQYTFKEGGKTFAGIPTELGDRLRDAKLWGTADRMIGHAHNVTEFGGGFAGGLKGVFASGSPFHQEMQKEMRLMGGNWDSLFGGIGAGSGWYGTGEAIGEGVGRAVATLVLTITMSTNATLLLANTIRETFGWLRRSKTWGHEYITQPTKGIGYGLGNLGAWGNYLGWKGIGAATGGLQSVFPQGPYINWFNDYAKKMTANPLVPIMTSASPDTSVIGYIDGLVDRLTNAIMDNIERLSTRPIQVNSSHSIGAREFLNITTEHRRNEARAGAVT